MKWKLLLLIGSFHAIASTPLPSDLLPTIDVDDYTVLYKGPSGSHYQSGEPGKFVKGVYTFLDSNGRKQQVTYEADARGYRVKTATNNDKINQQVPSLKTELNSVRPTVRKEEHQLKVKEAEEENLADGSTPVKLESAVLDIQRGPHRVIEELLQVQSTPNNPLIRELIPPPVFDSHSAADHKKSAPQGTIRFKDAKRLKQNDKLGYNLGYPFLPGLYDYAL